MLNAADGDRSSALHLPDGLDPWLVEFIGEAVRENEVLRENGANEHASARTALLRKLLRCAGVHLDALIGVDQAATLLGSSKETVRRKVRTGVLPDRRERAGGHTRVRRADVIMVARRRREAYDPIADAQDVAKLRRSAA
jgi:excisionase family DNA binding protein